MPPNLAWHAAPLLVVVAGAGLASRYRSEALLFWVLIAAPLQLPVLQVRNAAVQASAALLVCLLSLCVWSDGGRAWQRLRSSPLTLPLLALALTAVLAGLQGALFYDPNVPGVHRQIGIQVYGVALIVLSVAAALLVAATLEPSDWSAMWWVLVVAGAWFLLAMYLGRLPVQPWGMLVLALAVSLVGARLLFAPPAGFWPRVFAVTFVGAALVEVVGVPLLSRGHNHWVSGWVALCVPPACLWWTWAGKRLRLVTLMAAVGGAVAMTPLFLRVVDQAVREGDFGRLTLWQDAFRIMSLRPLFGVGPGNYIDYVETYSELPFGSAHGNYQQVAGELGIVGLLVVAWLMWATRRVARDALRATQASADQAMVRGLSAWLVGIAAASVMGDYALPAYHNGGHTTFSITVYVWIAVGTLMAMAAPRRPAV